MRSSLSAKNWESVIPKALQIFYRFGTVGIDFVRVQEEMVDCPIPDFSAS